MVVPPAAAGPLRPDAAPVAALAAVLDHVVEIFVVVHPAAVGGEKQVGGYPTHVPSLTC